tara:strand:- start:471 stop:755 length:285 start_codon:yes stop_codon:yes gene_type:complete
MCMGGGGGGGFGGGGMGGGGSFAGSNFGVGSAGTGLSMGDGGDTKLGVIGGFEPTKVALANEGQKEFLGSKPGYDEEKLQALANKKGKSQLYVT